MSTGRSRRGWSHLVALVAAIGAVAVAADTTCADTPSATQEFSHALFDSLLAIVVTDSGFVDYPELVRQRDLLDAYLDRLAATSPITAPGRFPDEQHALAYWLNAYNASVLAGVADHYPIGGVGEVRGGLFGRLLRLTDDKAAFFLALRFDLGGQRMSLFYLEHEIVRGFGEPRIHFALNCASRSCPPLRGQAYDGARLETQLAEQTAHFLTLPHGLRIEEDAIVVSAIFSWFRADFEGWMEQARPGRPATLRAYLEEVAGELPADLPLRFDAYDWRLNDAGDVS